MNAKNTLVKLINKVLLLLAVKRSKANTTFLGSSYGGWRVVSSLLSSRSICYCAGAGEDITFDTALLEGFNCQVVCIDPTPRAIQHVQSKSLPDNFFFEPVALWNKEEVLNLYAPRNPADVSHSALNLQGTTHAIAVPAKSLSQLMREHGHAKVDLLKIDIEGAEHSVIENVLRAGIHPKQFCIEFDQPVSPVQLAQTLLRLRRANYRQVARSNWDVTFLKVSPTASTE